MKRHQAFGMALGLFIITNCAFVNAALPNALTNTSAHILTPASLDAVIGQSEPIIAVDNTWRVYQNDELGISLKCPSSWRVIPLRGGSAIGLYPPESDPNFPTPMIRIEWLNTAYAAGKPIVNTGGPITPIEVSGITGQQYPDGKMALPTQSDYVELPYRGGTLFFIVALGPTVNLVPQFNEILKTIAFLAG
jgi:hypothetical protein